MGSDLRERFAETPAPERLFRVIQRERMSQTYFRCSPLEREAVLNYVMAILNDGEEIVPQELAADLRYTTRHARRLIQEAQRRLTEASERDAQVDSLPLGEP